jgi:hypothetical protein
VERGQKLHSQNNKKKEKKQKGDKIGRAAVLLQPVQGRRLIEPRRPTLEPILDLLEHVPVDRAPVAGVLPGRRLR